MTNWKRLAHLGYKVGTQALLIGSGVIAGYRYSEYIAAAQKSFESSMKPSEQIQKIYILEELVQYANK